MFEFKQPTKNFFGLHLRFGMRCHACSTYGEYAAKQKEGEKENLYPCIHCKTLIKPPGATIYMPMAYTYD